MQMLSVYCVIKQEQAEGKTLPSGGNCFLGRKPVGLGLPYQVGRVGTERDGD